MKITEQDVLYVAHLARIDITAEELVKMTGQLDDFLRYVDKLQEVDTEGVEPVTHFFSLKNAFRDDEIRPSLAREEALKNSQQADKESFLVPRIL